DIPAAASSDGCHTLYLVPLLPAFSENPQRILYRRCFRELDRCRGFGSKAKKLAFCSRTVVEIHAVEITTCRRFVSGHDFSRAEKALFTGLQPLPLSPPVEICLHEF